MDVDEKLNQLLEVDTEIKQETKAVVKQPQTQ